MPFNENTLLSFCRTRTLRSQPFLSFLADWTRQSIEGEREGAPEKSDDS